MEIYQYDVYLGLKRDNNTTRWHNMKLSTTDDYPWAGTHWYRDWIYPMYTNYEKTAALNNFLTCWLNISLNAIITTAHKLIRNIQGI
jgi:hypothetical protein